jgi:DNA-binding NtrC family response regulator
MNEKNLKILLVEDDALTAQNNKRLLRGYGQVQVAKDVNEAHDLMKAEAFDIAFFDLNLHGELDGLKLLKLAKMMNLYSIVLSGEVRHEILEESFTNGAKDYLNKPFNQEKLNCVINRYFNFLKDTEFEAIINQAFITKSARQTEELYKIKNLSFSDKPVFISGPTGTGKRVVAHMIKDILGLKNFVEINCSQYNDDLFTSELLGHKKGAFSGATEDKVGLLELAHEGIIFLDEIHALSSRSQKTLLKAIEEKEFYPVGSNKKVKSNFRVISATCENIHALIQQGTFRQDLYARISTFNIELLALKDRSEDINLLFEYFISKQPFRIIIKESTFEILKNYSWPQNTREIQDLVENWVVHGHRLITPDILPIHIRNNIRQDNSIVNDYLLDLVEEMGLSEFLIRFKKELIQAMIQRHGGVMKYASDAMRTSYPSLSEFLKKNKNKSFNTRSLQ